MCGLFGYTGRKKPNLDKLKILGILNETRGKDSTGVFYNQELKKELGLFRNTLGKENLFYTKGKPKSNVFLGHTRAGTVGATTITNAHPFDFLKKKNSLEIDQKSFNFVGMHNGTLYNHKELATKYSLPKEYDMDSKILLGAFIKEGVKVFKDYIGAAAIFVYDIFKNELSIWKGNSGDGERTLYMLAEKDTNDNIIGYYFSSVEDHLKIICDNKTLFHSNIEVIPDNTLLVFNKEKIIKKVKVDRDKSKRRPLLPPVITFPIQRYSQGYGSYYRPPSKPSIPPINPCETLKLLNKLEEFKNLKASSEISLNKNLQFCRNGHPIDGAFQIKDRKILGTKDPNYFFKSGYQLKESLWIYYSKQAKVNVGSIKYNSLCPYIQGNGNSTTIYYGKNTLINNFTFPIVDIELKVGTRGKIIQWLFEKVPSFKAITSIRPSKQLALTNIEPENLQEEDPFEDPFNVDIVTYYESKAEVLDTIHTFLGLHSTDGLYIHDDHFLDALAEIKQNN